VFRDPPDNLTPMLDAPVAAESAKWYADLMTKYGPPGILSYSERPGDALEMTRRANIRTHSITWLVRSRTAPRARCGTRCATR